MLWLMLWLGCGGAEVTDDTGTTQPEPVVEPGSHAVCAVAGDCADGEVCIAESRSGDGRCQLPCTVDEDCIAPRACAQVGTLSGLLMCTEPPNEEPNNWAEVRPRVPCDSDGACDDVSADSVCGAIDGVSECTVTCTEAADCAVPAITSLGVGEFLICLNDENDSERSACLLWDSCLEDDNNCIDFFPYGT